MFEQGTLWETLGQVSARALANGSLQPIPTNLRSACECDVSFVIRMVDDVSRKATFPGRPDNRAADWRNPFLPYDPQMFVADVPPAHVALLNKFNVVAHHLLVVTRAFEEQESLLTEADFEAFWTCMAEFPALGFYNSGAIAGASQPHKHLQLIPLPLAPQGPQVPIEFYLRRAVYRDGIGIVEELPFVHALSQVPWLETESPGQLAKATLADYHRLLRAVGVDASGRGDADRPAPYNLIMTREWMFLVPRARECFASISLNALAFAGTFLVRHERQRKRLCQDGPMAALRQVGIPR